MILKLTKAVHDVLDKRFKAMLLNGSFPEIKYVKNDRGFTSFLLFEYSNTWARYSKHVDARIKSEGLDPQLGVFSRKRSADFLKALEAIVNDVTESDVRNQEERFRSFADGVVDAMSGN